MARPNPHRKKVFAPYRETIEEGMARTLWVYAYARYVEGLEPRPDYVDPTTGLIIGLNKPGPNQDWEDVAPETPAAGLKAARALIALYEAGSTNGPDIVE